MKTVRCACVINVAAAYSYDNRPSSENMQQLAMILVTVRHACLMYVAVIHVYTAMKIVSRKNTRDSQP